MSKSTKEPYNVWLYWIPTIFLTAGLIGSAVMWLTVTGPPEISQIAKSMDAPNTWVFYVLPLGQVVAAIFILNRKMPTVRILAYGFVMFYNGQLALLLLNGEQILGFFLEVGKVAVALWAYLADRNRIAKTLAREKENETLVAT
jgi:hypothetical protein